MFTLQVPAKESNGMETSLKGQDLYLEHDETKFLNVFSLIALTYPVKRKQIQSCFSKLVLDNKTEWSILVHSTK